MLKMMEAKPKAVIQSPREKGQMKLQKTIQQDGEVLRSKTFDSIKIENKLGKKGKRKRRSQSNVLNYNVFIRDDQLELEIEKNEKDELRRMKYKQSVG